MIQRQLNETNIPWDRKDTLAVDDFVVLDPFIFVDFLFVALDTFALVFVVLDPFEAIE